MESFSNVFVAKHANAIRDFTDKWGADSLHFWSRQWEYPFTFSHIQEFANRQSMKTLNILDAGSGCTFFPYYITQRNRSSHVYCCDNDLSLFSNFERVNKSLKGVEFSTSDLENLEYEDCFFDIVYCISVLEHTKDPNKILSEFKRTLKKQGLLILTFDISLDGILQISIEEAINLLKKISTEFKKTPGSADNSFESGVKRKDILTTSYIKNIGAKRLLPWRLTWRDIRNQVFTLQFPKQLVTRQFPRTPFFELTFFCGAWQNQ